MKASTYLTFNGNCAEAITLYEKAFGVKAEIMRYKDAPETDGYIPPAGTDEFIMHAQFDIGGSTIMLCDVPPDMKFTFGNGIAIHAQLDDIKSIEKAFDILKEGGKVMMKPQKTFWSACFGSLEDKFGVGFMLSLDCE